MRMSLVNIRTWMCNAGVIGLHRQDAICIRHALELCDALLATGSKLHIIEQLSVSEILRISKMEILYSRGTVVHYRKAKPYMHRKISETMRATKKQPWEFERLIPYWYPFVKLLKLTGQYP